jgi:hypothetical protein
MNKVELEIAKRIAEIEGYDFTFSRGCVPYVLKEYMESPEHPLPTYYNPFDWAILGPLMIKYSVGHDAFFSEIYSISNSGAYTEIKYGSNEEIPRAILECIIKSKEA